MMAVIRDIIRIFVDRQLQKFVKAINRFNASGCLDVILLLFLQIKMLSYNGRFVSYLYIYDDVYTIQALFSIKTYIRVAKCTVQCECFYLPGSGLARDKTLRYFFFSTLYTKIDSNTNTYQQQRQSSTAVTGAVYKDSCLQYSRTHDNPPRGHKRRYQQSTNMSFLLPYIYTHTSVSGIQHNAKMLPSWCIRFSPNKERVGGGYSGRRIESDGERELRMNCRDCYTFPVIRCSRINYIICAYGKYTRRFAPMSICD